MSSSKVSPVPSSSFEHGRATRNAAAAFLPALLSVVSVEMAEKVCDLVCVSLLALLDGETAPETVGQIMDALTPSELALFELVFTAALGACPAYALEDLDPNSDDAVFEWGEEPIHEAVCSVSSARHGLALPRHPGRPAPNPQRARP